jgi:LysR family transcriptional regulator, glycine cleavage system transcriptional activator
MRRRIPSTTALLCFEAAARTENFARAAETLNMTQSALSRQIQNLESYVKQLLFIRAKQRVRLTVAGKTLLGEISPQLEAIEATLLKIRSHDATDGALNVGVYPTLGSRWLMPKIVSLAESQPGLTLNTITFLSNAEIDASLIDLAIVQGDPPWPGFRADALMSETLVVVASPSLTNLHQDPHELMEHRILQHTTRPGSWDIWLQAQGLELPCRIIGPMFSQFEMLIDAIKACHGIAIVPKILVERELTQGTLVRAHPFEVTPESAYYLLTPTVKIGIGKIERLRKWFLKTATSPSL